jgi:phosphate transport system ATP-binding protein
MAPERTQTEPTIVDEDRTTAPTPTPAAAPAPTASPEVVFGVRDLSVYYGDFRAVRDVDIEVRAGEITAFIGPSGCGKTTVLRCFNRMNDLIDIARVEGSITYHGVDLYDRDVNPVEVRRRIGMVFQKPNPFPKSIYCAALPSGTRSRTGSRRRP